MKLLDYKLSIFNDTTVFIGDCHSHFANFESFIEYFLLKKYNNAWNRIICVGLATETISGLSEPGHKGGLGIVHKRPCIHERLDRIISEIQPNVIFSCYGMTDGLFMPFSEERFAAYKNGIMLLIEKCRQNNIKLVIMTPPIYEESARFRYSTNVLGVYSKWLCELPEDDGYCVLDLHSKLRDFYIKNKPKDKNIFMTGDRIHWTLKIHMLVAMIILESIGVDVSSEYTLDDVDWISQDKTFKFLFDCRVKRTSEWLKHIGYNREVSYPPGSGNIVSVESEIMAKLSNAVFMDKT